MNSEEATVVISSRFLEMTTGFQFIVCCGMVVFFFAYLVRMFRQTRKPIRWRWLSPQLKLGWSLMAFALGEAVNRGMVWYARHQDNAGHAFNWTVTFTIVAFIAAIISSWGGLCALRVATPAEQGEMPWLIVLFVALGFGATMAYGWK